MLLASAGIRQHTDSRRLAPYALPAGMLPPVAAESEARRRSEEVREARRAVQAEHQRQYEQALVFEKDNVRRTRGDIIKEEIADAARCWYMDYKANTGKFPDFPSEESGGSAVLFSRQGAESEMSKSTAPSSKDSKGREGSFCPSFP